MSYNGVALYGRYIRIYSSILDQRPGCRETCIKHHSVADRAAWTCTRLNDAINGNSLIFISSFLILLWSTYFGTHTVFGALIEAGLAGLSSQYISWSQLQRIVLSWFVSPVLSSFLSSIIWFSWQSIPKRSAYEPQAQTVQSDLYFSNGTLLNHIYGNHFHLRQQDLLLKILVLAYSFPYWIFGVSLFFLKPVCL